MAFKFKTRFPKKLFYPTLHTHDGNIPETEEFDHFLFTQHTLSLGGDWRASPRRFFNMPTNELMDSGIVYRMSLKGEFPNEDLIFDSGPKFRAGMTRKTLF